MVFIMAKIVRFTGTISKQGEEIRLVVIPKRLHPKIKKYLGVQAIITIEIIDDLD